MEKCGNQHRLRQSFNRTENVSLGSDVRVHPNVEIVVRGMDVRKHLVPTGRVDGTIQPAAHRSHVPHRSVRQLCLIRETNEVHTLHGRGINQFAASTSQCCINQNSTQRNTLSPKLGQTFSSLKSIGDTKRKNSMVEFFTRPRDLKLLGCLATKFF